MFPFSQVVLPGSRASQEVFDRELEVLLEVLVQAQKALRRVIPRVPRIFPPAAGSGPTSAGEGLGGRLGGAAEGSEEEPSPYTEPAAGGAEAPRLALPPAGDAPRSTWTLRGVSKTVRRTAAAAYGAVSEAVASPLPRPLLRLYGRRLVDLHRALAPLARWEEAALRGPPEGFEGERRSWWREGRGGGGRELALPPLPGTESVAYCQQAAAWMACLTRRRRLASVSSFLWDVLGEAVRRDVLAVLDAWMAHAEYRLRSQKVDGRRERGSSVQSL